MDNSRLCIFLVARCGSDFVRATLDPKRGELPTTPKCTSLLEDSFPGEYLPVDYIMKTPEIKEGSREIYAYYVPTEASGEYLLPPYFPGDPKQWRFVYLLRDPRNRIVSYLNWGKVKEKDLSEKERGGEIDLICNAVKISTSGILEMSKDPRFTVLRFEDLVEDPTAEFARILRMINLKLDTKKFQQKLPLFESNSSFGDKGTDSNNRWKALDKKSKALIKDSIGQEIIDLGYEKDLNW
jgi:hypothetical protein